MWAFLNEVINEFIRYLNIKSGDGNFHGWGMAHAKTASPKPSSRDPLRVGDAVVGRGNAGWTTPKSGHPRPCQS